MPTRVRLVFAVAIGAMIVVPVIASAAAATESHWWVSLAFVNSRPGAVVEGNGIK